MTLDIDEAWRSVRKLTEPDFSTLLPGHGAPVMGNASKKVRDLFKNTLGINLDFQDFDGELKELPGEYAPPYGCLLLAEYEKQTAGCVALREFAQCICEMKRLHVRPVPENRQSSDIGGDRGGSKDRLRAHAIGHSPINEGSDNTIPLVGFQRD
jgi:hypothetical protein